MERGKPLSPAAPAGGAEVAKMGDGETVVERAAGTKDENVRGTGNSARIKTSTAMTSLSAGTGSSTSYLHSNSNRNPGTSSRRRSIPGIVGVAAGAAHRSSITRPVMVGARATCHSNSPTRPTGKNASCIIKERVVLVGARAGSSHGTLVGEVTWGEVPLPPLARNLTASSNSGASLADR